ncbi:integrase [Agrobacterium sp. SOY23]|uniref:integrase n=1 Tax=Agrobacterium sp. SOY23 TaxID=3014555 RepID=UPI0022AED32F|nr:integrase [Agrobacterium sp. SOY23]MCZ4431938.1 integrase [Agrobacterium sp. SOY23]
MGISQYDPAALGQPAWNAGKQVGVKKPLKQRQIWAARFFLDREGSTGDNSKLRSCDLVKIKMGTLVTSHKIRTRVMVVQQRTGNPVQFETTAEVRASLLAWLQRRGGMVEKGHLWRIHRRRVQNSIPARARLGFHPIGDAWREVAIYLNA